MYNHLLYLGYWVVNTILIYIIGIFSADGVLKLGNDRLNGFEASIYTGFWLTFIVWIFWDCAIARNLKFSKKGLTYAFFFVVNFFSIWVVSRLSFITGFTLTNYILMLIIALVATLLQRIVWGFIVKRKFSLGEI